jgi:hypothetical protein
MKEEEKEEEERNGHVLTTSQLMTGNWTNTRATGCFFRTDIKFGLTTA